MVTVVIENLKSRVSLLSQKNRLRGQNIREVEVQEIFAAVGAH